jgi:hypothetical protein
MFMIIATDKTHENRNAFALQNAHLVQKSLKILW